VARKEPVVTTSRREKPEGGSLVLLFRKRHKFKFGTIVLVSTARLSLVSMTTISNPSFLPLYKLSIPG
jgi:hypothetical protein